MANGNRLLVEVLVAALLLIVFLGIWTLSQRGHERAMEEREAAHRQTVEALEQASEAWAALLVHSEAEAVARAFSAGIHPAVVAGRQESLQAAMGSFFRLPGIAFVHVLRPDGRVLASSDRVLEETGEAGDRAAWALEARALRTRPGVGEGITEIAVPIAVVDEPRAVLWMGYDTDRKLEAARPPQ